MSKDPAFLFYPGDWMGGTQWMTMEQKGCYIELLILQFNTGMFTEAQAKQVLSISFTVAWPLLKQKFSHNNGMYWNDRLAFEIDKRKNFSESRRKNALHPKKKKASVKHMPEHMEDENRNEDIITIVEYLNNNSNKNYKPTSQKTKDLIMARFKEGFTVADFKKAIDTKITEWLNTDMDKFLRPETLFSNKFEGYLNQSGVSNLNKSGKVIPSQ